ncbi:UvrB/UvrC motif-containing protein [Chryseobacterium sp. CH1]
MIEQKQKEMEAAAKNLDFIKAAKLREKYTQKEINAKSGRNKRLLMQVKI